MDIKEAINLNIRLRLGDTESYHQHEMMNMLFISFKHEDDDDICISCVGAELW